MVRLFIVFLIGIVCGCRPPDPPETKSSVPSPEGNVRSVPTATVSFVEKATASGIRFIPTNGEEANLHTILETLGAGVAIWDFDRDGNQDLFFCGGGDIEPPGEGHAGKVRGRAPGCFLNRGHWQFKEVSELAGVHDLQLYSHAAVAGDYDNDGFTDLLVTGYQGIRLYHNLGDGTFRETSGDAGIQGDSWNTSAAWADLNSDGVLDLYLVRYVNWSFDNNPICFDTKGEKRDVCPPSVFEPLPDRLYLGDGEGGFRDATLEAKLTETGMGLAVILGDIELDGDVDIYVGNDTTPNLLYLNDGNGAFQEMGIACGAALSDIGEADGSMGVDLGDYNLDGLPDIWVANFEDQTFALYRNDGQALFQHVSNQVGIAMLGGVYVGFGTGFFDYDQDGDEDLFATNGHVMRVVRNAPIRQLPLLFENHEGKRFANVAHQAGDYFRDPHMGRGAAFGDLDNDGDLDLAISHLNEPIALLENRSQPSAAWLGIQLVGTRSNRDAIGARILVRESGKSQLRLVKGGGSYLSTNDGRVFFGFGNRSTADRMVSLEIVWPGGLSEVHSVQLGRFHTLIEPSRSRYSP